MHRMDGAGPTPPDANSQAGQEQLQAAVELVRRKEFAAGLAILEALSGARTDPEATVQVYLNLGRCLRGLKRAAEAEARLKEAAQMVSDGRIHTELAEILYAGRRPDEARTAAETALALDPAQTRARAVLSLCRRPAASQDKANLAIWPPRTSTYEDVSALVRTTLLQDYGEADRFITRDSRFVTLGSCFADNLAQHLVANGFDAASEVIGEQVNSTLANRYLLEWIEQGVVSDETALMREAFGDEMRASLRRRLADCDAFVFSLGVAPTFFGKDDGRFFFINTAYVSYRDLLANCVMRTTTVAENADNLRQIIGAVRRLGRKPPKIILTVSPVPLAATAEMRSAVIADCLSKSTLRLACEEVLQQARGDGVLYWPSFEIVRWLAPHFGQFHPPVFGADDAKARHVSDWIVELVVQLFLETFSVAAQP